MEHSILMQYVEGYLKENGLWMSTEDRKKAALTASHLYCIMDYSSFEDAAEDAIKSVGETVHDFELKISYHSGKLAINYCDGTDTEICAMEPYIDEISEVLQSAISDVLFCQDKEESEE